MNFFEHQQRARQQTTRLLLLFSIAVVCLILLTSLAVAAMGYVLGLNNARLTSYETGQSLWEVAAVAFHWQYLGGTALVILLLIGMASWFRLRQLSEGGRAIAEQFGGHLINTHVSSVQEQRLLNIVEEMAIASGVPVPSVYVIDEPGINAFAAGYKPVDAIIGVTRGAVEHLSRDELQGVIAHEFSHILNGDMRLNLRLVGIIYGIMVIATTGRYLLHGGRHSRRDRGAVLSIGLALIVIGYLGVFFGNLIKAAISRQREYLADASAVQFTRNQQGLAGALKKIGGLSDQSYFSRQDSHEVSHMLFAQGLRFRWFQHWMSTHPPLDIRIKRVDPRWNGRFPEVLPVNESMAATDNNALAESSVISGFSAQQVSDAVDHGGELTQQTVASAHQLLDDLQDHFGVLCDELHQPYSARAWVCALLMETDEPVVDQQQSLLQQTYSLAFCGQVAEHRRILERLSPQQAMVALDIALPVLKTLSDSQYKNFKQLLIQLIKVDRRVLFKEWALFNLVNYYCRPRELNRSDNVKLAQRKPALAQLLSAMTVVAVDHPDHRAQAFHAVAQEQLGLQLRWYPEEELSIRSLSQSLHHLQSLHPLHKPRLLKACIVLAERDGVICRDELQLLRCLSQALDCPLALW